MKNLTLVIFMIASMIVILSFILVSCGTPIEAQDVLEPSVVTVDDLTAILEGMPLSDVKTAISKIDPEVRASVGIHALNTLNSVSNEAAFDAGRLLEGEVQDGASSALLDALVNECLAELPLLASGNLTAEQTEELVNSHCFTNMRLKFKDLNEVYSAILEEVLAKQYTLPPL